MCPFVYFLNVVNGCVCVRPSFDVESSTKKKQRKERKNPSNLTTVDCHEEAEKEKSRAEARKKNATSCFCDSHDNTNKENKKEVLN